MNGTGGRIAAAGTTFVILVLGGFAAGIVLTQKTGSSLWAIAGTFVGLALGLGAFLSMIVRAVR